ncbi:hypothetical protein K525DRAFT_267124 [Schizophyllum commune Loenen D]|nr:hypothetical protein K525DRAFT_267124 [Schizophyllum commune Loenen D]
MVRDPFLCALVNVLTNIARQAAFISIRQKFQDSRPSDVADGTFPARLLTPSLANDLFAWIDKSCIPVHPLDHDDTLTIAEAIDALYIYAVISNDLSSASTRIHDSVHAHAADFWAWLVWLSPHSGNVVDDKDFTLKQNGRARLLTDGNVIVAMDTVSRALAAWKPPVLPSARVSYLLAQPEYVMVVMSLLTRPPSPSSRAMFSRHLLLVSTEQLLASSPTSTKESLRTGMLQYTQDHPGMLMRALAPFASHCLAAGSAMSQGIASHIRFIKFFGTDLDSDLLAADIVPTLVDLLRSWTVLEERGRETEQDAAVIMWASLLERATDPRLASSRHSRWASGLIKAMETQLLFVLYMAIFHIPQNSDTRSKHHRDLYRQWAVRTTQTIATYLVWPKFLRAFRAGLRRSRLGDEVGFSAFMPEWDVLLKRYHFLVRARQLYKEELASLRQTCGNPECTSHAPSSVLKMCACESIFYCSKECQAKHWASHHRADCAPVEHFGGSHETVGRSDDLSPAQLLFLRKVATEFLLYSADLNRMKHLSHIRVDLVIKPSPVQEEAPIYVIDYGDLGEDTNPAAPINPQIQVLVHVQKGPHDIVACVACPSRRALKESALRRRLLNELDLRNRG